MEKPGIYVIIANCETNWDLNRTWEEERKNRAEKQSILLKKLIHRFLILGSAYWFYQGPIPFCKWGMNGAF